jgi:hypothetical protein
MKREPSRASGMTKSVAQAGDHDQHNEKHQQRREQAVGPRQVALDPTNEG